MVKFTAYDFSIHGGLKAKVTQISPDSIEDKEKGVWYYQVRLETESNVLGSPEKPPPIIPGMTTQVDILTGEKTVLDYLLKPILKTKNWRCASAEIAACRPSGRIRGMNGKRLYKWPFCRISGIFARPTL